MTIWLDNEKIIIDRSLASSTEVGLIRIEIPSHWLLTKYPNENWPLAWKLITLLAKRNSQSLGSMETRDGANKQSKEKIEPSDDISERFASLFCRVGNVHPKARPSFILSVAFFISVKWSSARDLYCMYMSGSSNGALVFIQNTTHQFSTRSAKLNKQSDAKAGA